MEKRVLAVDLGASSGRVALGRFDGEKIFLEEIRRFSNDPVKVGGVLYWDVLRLFHEIKKGLADARLVGGFESAGIDAWGVDFGLLDEYGALIENPVHYRDPRTAGLVEECAEIIPDSEFYATTGVQFMELNTVYQLYSLKKYRPRVLERADKLLFMSDLFGYMLTGKAVSEYSVASTSQAVDIKTKNWAAPLLKKLGVPLRPLGKIVPSGSVLGKLRADVAEECGLGSVNVISVCGHDTQSAITAVPCPEGDFAFISSGTWSLFGTELAAPIINEKSLAMNMTNEGGYGSSVGFLKNIVGLWLVQESRRYWNGRGKNYSYSDLEKAALESEPFASFVDPDAPEFVSPGNMPERIREYCRRSGQRVPESVGEVVRCIYESLAMKYRLTLDALEDCTGKRYPSVRIIGGGVRDSLLCKMTASSCGRTVFAGPVEATVLGNIAVQLISDGAVRDVAEARRIIGKSEKTERYLPENASEWSGAYGRFKTVIKK